MVSSEQQQKIVKKTDEEWKKQLTPEQYEVCRKKGTELPFQESIIILRKKEYTDAYVVEMGYSVQTINSIQALDGLVSHNQSNLKMSKGS